MFLLIRGTIRIFKKYNDPTFKRPDIKNDVKMVAAFALISAVSMLVSLIIPKSSGDNNGYLNQQTIDQIKTEWDSNRIVDYEDVYVFEEDINRGYNLVGATVTFEVLEIHPESSLGFNIYAGKHLNFVSDSNPNVKEGDKITVIVTSVENILSDSYKITYVRLD